MTTKPCRDENHEGENPLPESAFYTTNPVYCKDCVVRRVKETRARQVSGEVLINGYLKRHLQKRAEESALEASLMREKQEPDSNAVGMFWDLNNPKPVFRDLTNQMLRQQQRKFSWRAC